MFTLNLNLLVDLKVTKDKCSELSSSNQNNRIQLLRKDHPQINMWWSNMHRDFDINSY
jgi:hypothetical protein